MNNLTARAVQGAVRSTLFTLLIVCFFVVPHLIVAASFGNVA
ncbi:hypothetical protein [Pseudarthrobacter oxydans]